MKRAEEIRQEVIRDRGGIWDAYDQGRWAAASGYERDANPHIPGHVNHSDWLRGFDRETGELK